MATYLVPKVKFLEISYSVLNLAVYTVNIIFR